MYISFIVSYFQYKMNKSVIRKVSVIFTLSLIVTYFILLGLWGEDGFFHARSLRGELEVLRQREEILQLQVDSLQQQRDHMTSQDALKDAAFRFGYQEKGEQVFYFENGGETEPRHEGQTPLLATASQVFPGLSKLWIALMALAFSSLITIVWTIVTKRRVRHR